MKSIAVSSCLVAFVVLMACTDAEREAVDFHEVQVAREDDGCELQGPPLGDRTLVDELEADVDQNGIQDLVSLHVKAPDSQECSAFVTVAVMDADGNGFLAWEPISTVVSGGLEEPRINKLAQLDGGGSLEIVIDEAAGASTQFVGAFTLVDRALERITPPKPSRGIWSGEDDWLFPYGGSVGHLDGADCSENGIVVSNALPAARGPNAYVVKRRFFDLEGAHLRLRDTHRVRASADELFEDYPEFRAAPFGSCPNN